jgi:hypothetical protein
MQTGPNYPNQPSQPQPAQAAPTQPNGPRPSRRSGKVLAIVAVAYVLGWWFAFTGAVGNVAIYSIAVGVLTLLCLGLFAIDWRGYTSLAGLIKWRQMSTGGKVGMGCLFYCFLPFMPAIYLVRAIQQYYRTTGQTLTSQVGQFFRTLPQRTQGARMLLLTGSLVAAISFCSITGIALGSGNPAFDASSPSSTTNHANSNSNTGNAVTHATATSSQPAPTATPQPTATSIPQPTATPKPSCIAGAVNCNPWGYNFSHGSVIYNPPGSFCDYFNCIASFWTSTNGYVEECQDRTYSHSGGRSGSCSHHGGNWRALLKP